MSPVKVPGEAPAEIPHFGRPFLDPEGKYLTLGGRTLQGFGQGRFEASELTHATLRSHPAYDGWLKSNLYAGRAPLTFNKPTKRGHFSIEACNAYVNSIPYVPGPFSTPPPPVSGSGSAPAIKNVTPKEKNVACKGDSGA